MAETKAKKTRKKGKTEKKEEIKVESADIHVIESPADSPNPLMNMVVVGVACFVFGFLLASSLDIDLSNGGSNVTTTIPVVTTTTIPSSVKLNVVVLNDKRCSDCISGMESLLAQLGVLFPDMEVKSLDYGSSEGKQLYSSLDLKYLPVILFDEHVEEADNYGTISSYLEEKGGYLSLRIGASFDPTAEICDNGVDDNGDGEIDCDDETCASKLLCNEDAVAECAVSYNLTTETVIFFHSNSCGWCAKMKPGVEQLQNEGYSFYWVEVSDSEAMKVVEDCIQDYMTSGSVPQFICVKNGGIKVGAFTDESGNLDLEAMRKYADDCKAA